ncbi:MAG TPA: response regulator [Pyrinomonadaceae bacterium]|nr:response regulator [Pyrinomonadaceae bacterium]
MSTETATTNSLDTKLLLKTLMAFKKGDFSARLPDDWSGEAGKIAETLNDIIELTEETAKEMQRVSRVVGKEGKIVQRATLPAAGGSWTKLVDSANLLIDDMARPTSEMVRVIGAVANGDLSQRMALEVEGRPLKGEFLRTVKIVNSMVDQLGSFASEVTRVAREVGTEGKLGGEAKVKGVAGTWKDLTDSVNSMASNLTSQVRNIAEVTTAVAKGDLSKKITVDVKGEILELKNTINTMVDQLNSFASEVTRVAREVGTEGKLGGQADVRGVAGTWKDLTDNVNSMASNLTGQVRNIAEVTTAVAKGDLSKKITVDVKGEILELKDTINTMVDQLNSFASEVTRVAREVGTEGKLGGQADVRGVAGIWKDLTDNVNSMASNLTDQVRGIARVVTAVANGDLQRKLIVEAKGEIAELANTINNMTDTLATFADQVTSVAREVGVEGKLGGQAYVPGASGTWRDLTDNVNGLAANLTTQVRAIAEVSTAVTKGDLTRSITVEAQGEVAALKDNINEMILNLKDTTQKNMAQDWLKTNLARFTRMLQGQRDMTTVAQMVLSELSPLVGAQQGLFFVNQSVNGQPVMKLLGSYAFKKRKNANEFRPGEGLIGQCMLERERILLNSVPGDYTRIQSGLGEANPLNIVVLPVLFEGDVKAVIELSSFNAFSDTHLTFLDQLTESIGIVLNTIAANTRTEDLLLQSQSLTAELQSQQDELKKTNEQLEKQAESLRKSEELLKSQQEELQKTNDELQEKATLLARQKAEVEAKNREVEEARWAMEEKAEQLALTSKYKSEFLANMSHELRTPLNSMLILSQQLSDNPEKNLLPKQVQFAETIYSSGSDLLTLINDILDLSKIESGMMGITVTETSLAAITSQVERSFHQIAQDKGLQFLVQVSEAVAPSIYTDDKRLQQILNNLLSNAFKFTENGFVTLRIELAPADEKYHLESLNRSGEVLAFSVTDTGVGIPPEKQRIIFEAFQQADGTTSRKYGGTGLGLSISREIARLLGGEIRVISNINAGSTFTLYIPRVHTPFLASQNTVPAKRVEAAWTSAEIFDKQAESVLSSEAAIHDDRYEIDESHRVVLIVESDVRFARTLLKLARAEGFKGVVATTGNLALALARKYRPDAITLEIRLPDRDGWTVLDRLKHDAQTSHIPVHIISRESNRRRALEQGALTYLEKSAGTEELIGLLRKIADFCERRIKKLLIVKDDEMQRHSVVDLIGNSDIKTTAVSSGEEALAALQEDRFDCVVMDLKLPDMSGFELIENIQKDLHHRQLPIIVYPRSDLSRKEEIHLKKIGEETVIKEADSPERLLAETALLLHREAANLPRPKREIIEEYQRRDPVLAGRKVLVVDDDVRNIFALTSVLEAQKMEVLHAENGQEGIDLLKAVPDIDAVLMDIMMPEMDGYEAISAIRKIEEFRELPVIALTAKAMKVDRDRCLEVGASDYISKPLDIEQLCSLLRVWLYRRDDQPME